ncbi:6-phosphogluconolactonase [uncultured Georgenia sp.]|uniref:6-phosphogluconolactonase n=1 Tax=uncultured Georgenia sp. TaxID=378209 RepID=UPI0026355E1E|nr:6-phosphogluconolactonase [uncultured Georgenia sp.]HLS41021.1 6-phosphogluconolactonase [Ornithinicoccus sp.]
MSTTERPLSVDSVHVAPSDTAAGAAAGQAAARLLQDALSRRGRARVVFASAPSQDRMIRTLSAAPGIDWSRVESLHLDEYRGIDPEHRAGFGRWLADRLPSTALPGLRRIRTDGDARAEIERYGEVLDAAPVDLVCLGIGVNGHIAFNEPGDTDFADAALLREVPLAHASRQQQVDEGLFPALADVPTHALSLTVPAILRGAAIVGTVLGAAKAEAVAAALVGPVTPDVPASVLRTHGAVSLFLDAAAASRLPAAFPVTAVAGD